MPREEIIPESFPWLDTSRYSFSPGIEAAGAAWLAGQTAGEFDIESGRIVVRGDGAAQAGVCWAKIESVLDAASRDVGDCSEVTEYVTVAGSPERDAIAAQRPHGLGGAVGGARMSTFVVESLVRPDALVEVEVVAGLANGLVRVPQVLPLDDDGEVVLPGDFVGQCEWVLEEAGRRLEPHGLDLSHVVRVIQQTTAATRRQYNEGAAARRRLLGPHFPSSTGLLMPELPHPDVLVALDVWASSEPKSIVPYLQDAYASLTFSPAVAAGGLLFISGTTAFDLSSGETVAEGDIGGQAEFVYGEIGKICEMAGTSLDNLVKTVEYVTPDGVENYRDVGAVRQNALGRPFPVSTGVVVSGLLSRRWLIEVEAVAVIP
ncbi:RidA family protein [Candidatus Poriferisodalis sp.]|uniref:RidA family protein n=1 Tax=Candidatus Poriferisodalis sp. TaxID=3101277 RepID=UPI003B019D32